MFRKLLFTLFVPVLAATWLLAGCGGDALVPASPLAEPEDVRVVTPVAQQPPAEREPLTPEEIITVITTTLPANISDSFLSPSGAWRAEVVSYPCTQVEEGSENAYEQLQLVQRSDETIWAADSQLIYCGGVGAYGFSGLYWSPNSRFFYYTPARQGVPDGCGFWQQPIRSVEVATLMVTELGGGTRSPDNRWLATWQGDDLVIWEINEGEFARGPALVEEAVRGPVVWSPDSQSLLYLQQASECPLTGPTYLVHANPFSGEQHAQLVSEQPLFNRVTWDALEQITLYDELGNPWRYDVRLEQLLEP
jgi:hypothetical protein